MLYGQVSSTHVWYKSCNITSQELNNSTLFFFTFTGYDIDKRSSEQRLKNLFPNLFHFSSPLLLQKSQPDRLRFLHIQQKLRHSIWLNEPAVSEFYWLISGLSVRIRI